MTKHEMSDQDLDQLFAAARRSAPEPEPDFLAALGDAAVEALAAAPMPEARQEGIWSQISTWLGGWGGVGGLVAATVAGVWIGVSPPALLPDATQLLTSGAAEVDGFGVWVDVESTEFLAQDES